MAEVRIGREAQAEYDKALAWHDTISARSAAKFEAAVAEALERSGEGPERFPSCEEEGYRYFLLKGERDRLIYYTEGDVVFVVAVAHTSREPGYWSGRR